MTVAQLQALLSMHKPNAEVWVRLSDDVEPGIDVQTTGVQKDDESEAVFITMTMADYHDPSEDIVANR